MNIPLTDRTFLTRSYYFNKLKKTIIEIYESKILGLGDLSPSPTRRLVSVRILQPVTFPAAHACGVPFVSRVLQGVK